MMERLGMDGTNDRSKFIIVVAYVRLLGVVINGRKGKLWREKKNIDQ